MNSRTSVLLALSTGMMVGIVALPFLPKAKGPVAPRVLPAVVQPVVQPVASTAASLAASKAACVVSVDGFLGALSSGERAKYGKYLTPEAINGMGADNGLSFDGTGIEVYQVGEAEVVGDEAYVPVAMTIRGELQNMDLHLRLENGAWSIYGTSLQMGNQTVSIDFENGAESLELVAEDALDSVAKEMAANMQSAMEDVQEQVDARDNSPAKLLAEPLIGLEFEGDLPVELSFVDFVDRSDPQFTRVDVRVENHSNKAIVKVEASFHYLDAEGKELDQFPHSLTGPIGFSGQAPLALQATQKVNNVTAFFMPEATASVRIEILEVLFVDDSTWSAE